MSPSVTNLSYSGYRINSLCQSIFRIPLQEFEICPTQLNKAASYYVVVINWEENEGNGRLDDALPINKFRFLEPLE